MRMRNQALLTGAATLLIIGVVALLADRSHTRSKSPRPTSRPRSVSAVTPTKPAPGFFVPPKAKPKPASDTTLNQAHSDVRLRSTYRNFRTAVATGNKTLQESLKNALQQDESKVLQLAQEEVANSSSQREREINLKALEALRR